MRILHSILFNKGYNARMLFLKLNRKTESSESTNVCTDGEIKLFKQYIRDFEPNLIGFSLVSSNFTLYKRLYHCIRHEAPNSQVIVGGWQPSLNPEQTIQFADMVCIGEGDETIRELAYKLSHNESINDIRNIWIKRDTVIIKNSARPLIVDFDYSPFVFNDHVSSFIEDDVLIQGDPYKENERYGTMIGRGCPYHCTYCSNSYMVKQVYPKWSKIRHRKSQHVIDELLRVKETLPNVGRINFYDEVFVPRSEWAKDFFSLYSRLIGFPFYCMFFPGTCDEDTVKMLKDAGLAGVWVGIQSGSDRVRKEVFKRYYSNDVIKKQAEIFNKYGISVKYDLIFDNPFETEEETQETIDLMRQLPKPFLLNLFSLKYFPNTIITQMALEKGIITEEQLNDHLKEDHQNYFITLAKRNKIERLIYG